MQKENIESLFLACMKAYECATAQQVVPEKMSTNVMQLAHLMDAMNTFFWHVLAGNRSAFDKKRALAAYAAALEVVREKPPTISSMTTLRFRDVKQFADGV